MDNSHAAGTILGMVLGVYKAIISLTVMALLSWQAIFDTMILAFIGGVIGWTGAELMKYIKKRIFK
ncbi:MAG: hypothetical protein BWY74_01625 [Firmicutes bacterium ADurb.Bin419]|nr:MAG: hypothetical protein BWY74_01625 [Firmicutes bacterium ADurb.Bin419]